MMRTLSPRDQRAIGALMNGPIMRENLDAIVGCSNSPELVVAGLRRKGPEIPCERVERFVKNDSLPTGFEAKTAATAQASGSKTQ